MTMTLGAAVLHGFPGVCETGAWGNRALSHAVHTVVDGRETLADTMPMDTCAITGKVIVDGD